MAPVRRQADPRNPALLGQAGIFAASPRRCGQIAIAGEAALIGQAQQLRRVLGHAVEFGIVGLGEIDDLFVVAEIVGDQFRVPVEAERFQEKRLELAAEEIGHVEGHHVAFADRLEGGAPLVEGKAVRPRDALDAVPVQNRVEHPPVPQSA